jgi:hypothetical protein
MLVLETMTKARAITTAGKTTAARTMIRLRTTIAARKMTVARMTTAGHLTHLARDPCAGLSWALSLTAGGKRSRIIKVEFRLFQIQMGGP